MSTSRYFTVLLRSAVTISLSFLPVFSNLARAAPAKLNIVILEGGGSGGASWPQFDPPRGER